MANGRERIAQWGKTLEALVATDRGFATFKHALQCNEFVNVMGHDSSIFEVVLNCDMGLYRRNVYTRVVWSERNPPDHPFAFKSYEYVPDKDDPEPQPEKPKQAFFDDADFSPEYLTAAEVASRLGL